MDLHRPGRGQDTAIDPYQPKKDCTKPTDGMMLFYTDLDRTKVKARRVYKTGCNAADSNVGGVVAWTRPAASWTGAA